MLRIGYDQAEARHRGNLDFSIPRTIFPGTVWSDSVPLPTQLLNIFGGRDQKPISQPVESLSNDNIAANPFGDFAFSDKNPATRPSAKMNSHRPTHSGGEFLHQFGPWQKKALDPIRPNFGVPLQGHTLPQAVRELAHQWATTFPAMGERPATPVNERHQHVIQLSRFRDRTKDIITAVQGRAGFELTSVELKRFNTDLSFLRLTHASRHVPTLKVAQQIEPEVPFDGPLVLSRNALRMTSFQGLGTNLRNSVRELPDRNVSARPQRGFAYVM